MDELDSASFPMSLWQEYRVPIVLGGISVTLIVISLILIVKSFDSSSPVEFTHADISGNGISQSSPGAELASIYIDIEGAVVHPGMKVVTAGSRVEDVIAAAGGFTRNADSIYIAQKINRAMKVVDGMKLYIPFIDETSHIQFKSTTNTNDVAQSMNDSVNSGEMSQNNGFVSINTASLEELDVLPGIGPATASKIIEKRPYETLEDLLTKKAVGQSVFTKILSRISL